MSSAFFKMLEKYQREKLTQFASEPAKTEPCLLFLGDSIMDLFKTEQLRTQLTLVNRGISGIDTSFLLEHFDEITRGVLPEKIFLLIGTNDLGQGEDPLSIYCRIDELCHRLSETFPKALLYLQSVYPTHDSREFFETVGSRTNDRIEQLNQLLQGTRGVTYLDVHDKLIDLTGQLDKSYTTDGLHLSPLGYDQVAEVLETLL